MMGGGRLRHLGMVATSDSWRRHFLERHMNLSQHIQPVAPAQVVIHSQVPEGEIPEGSIFTNQGVLPLDTLTVKTIVSDEQDAVVTATEFYLQDVLVRRDVNLALKPKDILNIEAQEI